MFEKCCEANIIALHLAEMRINNKSNTHVCINDSNYSNFIDLPSISIVNNKCLLTKREVLTCICLLTYILCLDFTAYTVREKHRYNHFTAAIKIAINKIRYIRFCEFFFSSEINIQKHAKWKSEKLTKSRCFKFTQMNLCKQQHQNILESTNSGKIITRNTHVKYS